MNGAESLVRTLLASGVDTCFANPGTSEMHFVAALDQAPYHRPYDPPLTADTEGLARTVSGWVRTSMISADVGRDAAAAVQAARTGQIATLVLPSDTSWDP